jgi:cytochrome c biogenesis protein CcdA/thiol-disulfide isomerase/thioredoxin
MELILVAFVAGLVTVLSPCILPMIPLVLATGAGGSKWRPLGVVAGLILSFTMFTLTLTVLVQVLGIPGDALRWLAVGVLAVFGVSLLVPAFGARLAPGFGPLARFGARGGTGLVGDLLLGATLGLVWAPCVGPIMASVIVLAATQHVTALTAAITLTYALGAGIPLLAIAYGGRALAIRLRTALGRAGGRVQQAMGGLLLVTCVLLATEQDLRLEAFVGSFLPADWTANLTAIEQQPGIADGLTTLPAATGAAPDVQAAAPALPTATTAPPPAPGLNLPDMGLAPELIGTGRWYNSAPTSLAALRGKVVIIDFWTFECYNCNNTLPYIKAWYDKYASQGLVILGVHTPEFAAERDADNVGNAIQE